MKKICYILIPFFIMGSHLIADCTADQTNVGDTCYHIADLEVLVAFATNSGLPMEYADVINMGSQVWAGNRRLTFLAFYLGELSGSIPSSIGSLTSLINLYIFSSPLTSTIPSSIGNLTNLINLYITGSQITGNIPSEIGNLVNLTALDLSNNEFSGPVPPQIGDLTNLTKLDLSYNDLEGSIPTGIGSLDDLASLDLRNNNLTGLIPNSFCNLSSVNITLNLSGNKLCEPYPTACDLADDIGTQDGSSCPCNYLSTNQLPVDGVNCYSKLDLDVLITFATNSNLSTEYIDVINMGSQVWDGNRRLTFLAFYLGELSGSIPSSIGSLTSLINLYIFSSPLTSTIPSSIGNLTNLINLYITGSQITGNIPSEIGNLVNLTALDLSNNEFSGPVPPQIGDLTNLTSLNLSSNNLTGLIPSEIGSYDLLSLDLSNNKFTGIIHEDICTYYGIASYYNFDFNILCPPYPQCSSTSSDEQLFLIQSSLFTYVPDENNDGDGNIDPLTWCEEEFCVDPPPPEGHDCYGFIIDDDPTDAADSCDPGQERDECGICSGSGADDIYDCCPINNNGYDDGTGPDGEEPDQCGVCGGQNTDCSSGQSAICPDADEYCGSCFGDNECIPQLVFTEPDINNGSIIDINTRTIRFHFSVPVNYIGDGGIEIDSYHLHPLDVSFTVETDSDSIIELTLTDPLISYDDLEITLDPCQIKNFRSNNILDETYCLDTNTDVDANIIPDGNLEPPIKKGISVSLLGDYDLDGDVDDDDLDTLISVWKTEDFSYELGPWSGEAPNLQPNSFGYDGDYNLHDLMGFVQMWSWDYSNSLIRKIQSTPTINYVPEYNFENNQMTLNIENFPGDVKMLSFQLNVSGSDIEIKNSVNSSQFDISLNGSHIEQGIYDWVMGSFSPLEQKNIDLFNIVPSTTIKDVNLQLAYEIVGFDQEISSGEIDIAYNPVPEIITISLPYPNPFNPITMINYGISEKSDLLIEIYNIQGRLVDKTVRSDMEAGYYTFRWDGSNQSSGIYLIRMKISDTVKNYRTLLIK